MSNNRVTVAVSSAGGTPTPRIRLLLRALKKLGDNWFMFGTYLGVPQFKLNSIESANSRDVQRCLLEMLEFWLDNTLNPSWNDVVEALEETDQLVLAAKVKRLYLWPSPVKKDAHEDAHEDATLLVEESNNTPTESVSFESAASLLASSVADEEIEAEITADIAVVRNLRDLKSSFAHMLVQIKRLLISSCCDLSDALLLLGTIIGSDAFPGCDDFGKLLTQLEKNHVDVFNIYYLQQLVACYDKQEMTEVIMAYDKKRGSFLDDTKVRDFQRAVVSRVEPILSHGKAIVTITVTDKMYELTLRDIEKLAMDGFEDCHKKLIRFHAKLGSIIISWIFPEGMATKLKEKVFDNIAFFKRVGVIEVTIAGEKILTWIQQKLDVAVDLQAEFENRRSKNKQLYAKFYDLLVERVSDPDTCHSLTTELHFLPEEKKAKLSSTVVSGRSYLKELGVEEKPHLMAVLMEKMSAVKSLQPLSKDMSAYLSGLKQEAPYTQFTKKQAYFEQQELAEDNKRLTSENNDLLKRLKSCEEELKRVKEVMIMRDKTISDMKAVLNKEREQRISHLKKDTADRIVTQKGKECVFQVFYQRLPGFNNFRFFLTIFPKDHLMVAVDKFSDMKLFGNTQDVTLVDDFLITISQISYGWNMQNEVLSVSMTEVQQYNGNGIPPYCETIVKAVVDDVTPLDLSFTVGFNGLQDPLVVSIEAQTVTDCIAQVFYYPLNDNCWKVKCAFFPTKYQNYVKKRIFQDTAIGPCSDKLNFSGGAISVSASNTAGWTVKMSDHKQVNTTAMERYNGEGEPPYLELTLKAVSDDSSDLSLPVTLTGIRQPNNIITLEREFIPSKGPIQLAQETDIDYLCPVCSEPLTEPYLSIECGHHLCRQCLDRLIGLGRSECPECRQLDALTTAVLDRNHQRKVKNLEVHCWNYNKGCEWVGKLRDLQDHVDPEKEECKIPCPFGCGKDTNPREMKVHTRYCSKRMISCENCGYYNMFVIVTENHLPKCPGSVTANASATVLPQCVNQAPMEIIIGDFSGKKRANEVWTSPPIHTHIRGYKFCLKVFPNGYDTGKGSHLSIYVRLIKEEHDDHLEWPFEGDIRIELLNWKEGKNHHSVTISLNRYNYHLHAYHLNEGATSLGYPQYIPHTDLAPTKETRYLLSDHFKLSISVAVYSTPSLPLTPSWQAGSRPVTESIVNQFTISEYSKRKQFNNIYFSLPFTTSSHGYTFCLKVYANGYDSGKGSHITITVVIMKGQHDDDLKWPFTGTIIVEVLNWLKDKGHHKRILTIDTNDGFDRVKNGNYGKDYGLYKFIPQSSLSHNSTDITQYLNKDCICIRVRNS